MVVVRVMVRVRVECNRVLIFPPEPSKECVKVSHVIFECRVINHHPNFNTIKNCYNGASSVKACGQLTECATRPP